MILVDTCIFVDNLRNYNSATKFLIENKNRIAYSKISTLELYQGCHNKQQLAVVKTLLSKFQTLSLNSDIENLTIELMNSYMLGFGLRFPDAFIAAIAMQNNLTLFTMNIKDFRFIEGLKFEKPYDFKK